MECCENFLQMTLLLGYLCWLGNCGSSKSMWSAARVTFAQNKPKHSSFYKDCKILTVIWAISWPAAADMVWCCKALLRLSVCLKTIYANILPNRNLNVCIWEETPWIRAFVSESLQSFNASSHVIYSRVLFSHTSKSICPKCLPCWTEDPNSWCIFFWKYVFQTLKNVVMSSQGEHFISFVTS